jgi:hypothetical protein
LLSHFEQIVQSLLRFFPDALEGGLKIQAFYMREDVNAYRRATESKYILAHVPYLRRMENALRSKRHM